MKSSYVDRIDELSEHIWKLEEIESLAEQAQPSSLPEIRSLIYAALYELRQLGEKILGRRAILGSSGHKIPMEVLERYFYAVRDHAESRWNKSMKLSGKAARRSRQEADQLAKMAQSAAASIKIAAESRGIWNDEYIQEHGLGPWI